jgi:hypothetical protein
LGIQYNVNFDLFHFKLECSDDRSNKDQDQQQTTAIHRENPPPRALTSTKAIPSWNSARKASRAAIVPPTYINQTGIVNVI